MLMEQELGTLEVGKRADLLLLKVDSSFWQPYGNLTNQLVFYENGRSVDTVIVEGNILMRDGQLSSIDETAVIDEAQHIAERLRRDNRQAFERVKQQMPYFQTMYHRTMQQAFDVRRMFKE